MRNLNQKGAYFFSIVMNQNAVTILVHYLKDKR